MIWYYWKVHGADWKWAVLLLSEGRSVQVQRELRVKANTLPGFWWDGTVTFSHNSPRQLSPQSHKPGGRLEHYDKHSRFDLIFTQRKKKGSLFLPFTWCILNFEHINNDRLKLCSMIVPPCQHKMAEIGWFEAVETSQLSSKRVQERGLKRRDVVTRRIQKGLIFI